MLTHCSNRLTYKFTVIVSSKNMHVFYEANTVSHSRNLSRTTSITVTKRIKVKWKNHSPWKLHGTLLFFKFLVCFNYLCVCMPLYKMWQNIINITACGQHYFDVLTRLPFSVLSCPPCVCSRPSSLAFPLPKGHSVVCSLVDLSLVNSLRHCSSEKCLHFAFILEGIFV